MFPFRHNLLLCSMLVLASWALAIGARTWAFSTAVTAVLLLHAWHGFSLPIKPRAFYAMLLAVPFALWLRYLPRDMFTGFPPIDLALMLGFYTVALGVFHLLCHRGGGNRDMSMACGVLGLSLAGAAPWHPYFIPIFILFLPLALLQLRSTLGVLSRRVHRLHALEYAVAVAALVALTVTIQTTGVARLPQLNRWMTQQMLSPTPSSLPPDRVSRLGSVMRTWEDHNQRIMLRVFGKEVPGHLRGTVFDHYREGKWRPIVERDQLNSDRGDRARNVFFILGGANAAEFGPVRGFIYPEPGLPSLYYLPLGTDRLACFDHTVYISRVGTARSRRRNTQGGYHYFAPRPLTDEPTVEDLLVPGELREPLAAIAADIFSPQSSPLVNSLKLSQWFENRFTYRIGIRLTTDKDPVLEFLQDHRAGHCEYFASAGVMLLRTAGIPARYVTGFVADEPGAAGGYWVARGRDAHAWVEMYTPGKGWVTYDPTPPSARPETPPTTRWQRLSDWASSWWKRFWAIATHGGALAVIATAWALVIDLVLATPIALWLVIAITASAWVFRGSLRQLIASRNAKPVSPRVVRWRQRLRQAERALARFGYERQTSQTVGQFIHELSGVNRDDPRWQAALATLREYQAARFGRSDAPPSPTGAPGKGPG